MTIKMWDKTESDNFIFYYLPNSYASQIIEQLIEERENVFQKLNDIFKVNLQEKIRWYFFPSKQKARELLGSLSPSQAIPATLTIFTIYSKEDSKVYDSTPGHELTHVLSFYWQNGLTLSYKFLSEGLARYLDQSGRDNHKLAVELKEKNRLFTFNEIITPQDFNRHDPAVTYVQSASLVQFLLENYGWDRFKKLWLVKDNLQIEIKRIYGQTLNNLESNWLEFLGELKKKARLEGY